MSLYRNCNSISLFHSNKIKQKGSTVRTHVLALFKPLYHIFGKFMAKLWKHFIQTLDKSTKTAVFKWCVGVETTHLSLPSIIWAYSCYLGTIISSNPFLS